MSSSPPSFIIVSGAWHVPSLYSSLLTLLRKSGYSATIPSLPSCDAQDPHNTTCSTDAEAIRKQIINSIESDGKDVVLICHSYGGVPGGAAAYGLSKTSRAKEGRRGGVIGLIYMCGFLITEGSSLLETLGGKHAPCVVENQPVHGQCVIKDARDVLFNDVEQSEADRLTGLLRPHSLLAFDSRAPPAAWKEPEFTGKLVYIRCLRDQAFPPFLQDIFLDNSGVEWKVKDIEASHSPFASKPEELVKIIVESAQQFG